MTLGNSREPPVLTVSSCTRAERNDARYYAHATKRLPSSVMLARAERLLTPGFWLLLLNGSILAQVRSIDDWSTSTPSAALVASDPTANAYLGNGVGLSGDTIVAGANGASATYVFVRNGEHWRSGTQSAKLASPGAGSAAVIHGDMIVAGADGAFPPDGAFAGGELFFYRKPSGGWRNTSKADGVLYHPGATPLYELGVSVAVENGTIVGGAQVNNGFGATPGAVCIFRPQ